MTFRDSNDVRTCEFHNPDFIICSSVLSFYIPCIIIIVLYMKIMKVIVGVFFAAGPKGLKSSNLDNFEGSH
jgi:hypothetical protein